jgi:magnesium transporter
MARKKRSHAGRADRKRHRRVTRIGAPPGTLDAHPESPQGVVSLFAYDQRELTEHDGTNLDDIPAMLERSGVVWLNVNGLGDAELIRRVGEIFGLHPLALEDVLNVRQRSKVEAYDDHVYVVTRLPLPGESGDTEQVSLFLGKKFVVTFQERPGDCLDPVRERIRQGRPRLRSNGPDYLAYAILDAVVDAYFPVLDTLGDRLEALEDEVLEASDSGVIGRLHAIKRELSEVKRVVSPMRETFTSLVNDDSGFVTEPTRVFLRDCQDHVFLVMERVESLRELGAGLRDLHLTLVSNRMNEVMKVLTIIATIFIPITFIAGIYGMNFDTASRWNMPELGWAFGYPVALGVMALAALAMLIYFRRKNWL